MTKIGKKRLLSVFAAVLIVFAMMPGTVFAEGEDTGGGAGNESTVNAILDFGANHADFAKQCAGDKYTVNGSQVTIPLESGLSNRQDVVIFLEWDIIKSADEMNIGYIIDKNERVSGMVGLKGSYSNSEEFYNERNSLSGQQINDGDTYYIQWEQPISSVKGTLKAPACGTEVSITYPSMYRGTDPAPEITYEGNVTTDNITPPRRWAKDSNYKYDEAFEGTITGGNEYCFEYLVSPTFGYYFTDDVTNVLNGGTVVSTDVFTGGEGVDGLIIKGKVTAEHYMDASAPTTIITKATPDADGSYSAICGGCRAELAEPILKPSTFNLSQKEYTYDGTAHKPAVTVTDANGNIIDVANYDVSYKNHVNAGNATATVTFKGDYYEGSKDVSYKIDPKKVTPKLLLSQTSYTYNGKARKPEVTVINGKTVLDEGKEYTVTGLSGCTNAGNYKVTVKLTGNLSGTASKTFTINKAANPLKVSAKTATVKYSKLKKKAQTLAVTKVIKFTKDAKDKKTYTLSSAKKGKKSFKKYFKINKSTGKVTVKKGLKKGTYKVKVKVKALGNNNYKASAVKTVTFKVKVK